MCERFIQEYRIWFETLLEVLHVVCEDVVPAGRFNEEAYWRIKALYREIKQDDSGNIDTKLLQYVSDGKILLEPLKEALEAIQGESITEETIIYLRRKHANAILTSLQMLANYSYLVEELLQTTHVISAEVSRYFEIDASDEVRRIRSGVVVQRKQIVVLKAEACAANPNGTRIRRFRIQRSENWKNSVAG